MKNITVKAYTVEELSTEAKAKALDARRELVEHITSSELHDTIENELYGRLNELGTTDSEIDIRYSLSYSQGDGVSFFGDITIDGVDYTITSNNPRYAHEYTMEIEYSDDDEYDTENAEKRLEKIQDEVRRTCRAVERSAYKLQGELTSDEAMINDINSDGVLFLASGDLTEEEV